MVHRTTLHGTTFHVPKWCSGEDYPPSYRILKISDPRSRFRFTYRNDPVFHVTMHIIQFHHIKQFHKPISLI